MQPKLSNWSTSTGCGGFGVLPAEEDEAAEAAQRDAELGGRAQRGPVQLGGRADGSVRENNMMVNENSVASMAIVQLILVIESLKFQKKQI